MIAGTKIRRLLHLPGLYIRVKEKNGCVSCGKCNKVCPMGVDVVKAIKGGQSVFSVELALIIVLKIYCLTE